MPRSLLVAASLAIAVAGCDAILGLGEEPNKGLEPTTGASASSAGGSTVSAGEASSASGAGGEVTAVTAGGTGGAPPATSSGTGGGGAPACADPEPVDFDCGPCDDEACIGQCTADMRCTRRIVRVPETSRVTNEAGSVFNRYGRGIAVGGGYIAFTRNTPSGPRLTTVAGGGKVANAVLPSGLYAIAGDPEAASVVLTNVDSGADATSLWSVPVSVSPPTPVLLGIVPPVERFGAMAWQSGSRFVATGRNSATLFTFDAAVEEPPCAFGTPQVGGAGVAIAHGLLDEADTVVAPHYDSEVVAVEVEPAVDACPQNGATETDAVLGGLDVDSTLGVAIACGHVYVQARVSDNGQASGIEVANVVATYPSTAIAAHRDRVYLPIYAGGVQLCNGRLDAPCDTMLGLGDAGKVALLAATRRGFVSVGLADDTKDESDTIVACVNHLDEVE